ncbi:MAG TPA: MgtC/SapB family protein [Isosphaeraceae bacterium]|jgi:putative Mg2+ transporter-C (MgtC) family protein|nr:MgtC/SapB family protein [Isosphaeraceae bacterium]
MDARWCLVRLAVAALLGGAVGLERHRSDKDAGLRTHMIVCLASALVMIVSAYGFDEVLRPSRVVLDPSRVAAQVVSGIGFLGGGMILRRHGSVQGLTTAASIWAVAAVGLAVGGGLYLAATATTLLTLASLAALRPVEDLIRPREDRRVLTFVTRHGSPAPAEAEALLGKSGLEVVSLHVRRGDDPATRRVEATLGPAPAAAMLALVRQLEAVDGVLEVGFEGQAS